jgi:hypothetical protein
MKLSMPASHNVVVYWMNGNPCVEGSFRNEAFTIKQMGKIPFYQFDLPIEDFLNVYDNVQIEC